jgi:hypothetical protein
MNQIRTSSLKNYRIKLLKNLIERIKLELKPHQTNYEFFTPLMKAVTVEMMKAATNNRMLTTPSWKQLHVQLETSQFNRVMQGYQCC